MPLNTKSTNRKISRKNIFVVSIGIFTIIFAVVFAGKFGQTSLAQNSISTDTELAETIERLTNRSMDGLVEEKSLNGGYFINLQGRFQNVVIAKKEADGDVATACVTSLGEANAFFGRNLKTGEPVETPLFKKDTSARIAAQNGISQDEYEFYNKLIEEAEQSRLLNPNSATITIVNNDGAGEGFNDPSPRSPEGGNSGTTLGQQRLIVFNRAAAIWGAFLDTNVAIRVKSNYDPLPCQQTQAQLGGARTITFWRDFPNATYPGTWHHSALSNKLVGSDLDLNTDEIEATFNSNIDDGCFGGSRFYYGLDNSTPFNTSNMLITVLHEMGHGLGFSSFVNGSTGQLALGFPDVFTRYMFDRTNNLYWYQMTDAQRQASALNNGNVLWDGQNVKTASGFLAAGRDTAGRVQLFTPSTLQGGSSISHFDIANTPNLLMEPAINLGLPLDLDLTRQQMRDIGWYRDTNADLTPDTITNITPSGGTVTIGSTTNVTWTNNGGFNRNVTIELSTDGGATFPITIASDIPNTGSRSFTVPNNPTAQGRIRVREHNFVQPSGISSANIAISTGGGCNYSINPSSASIVASGGSGSTAVTTSTGCAWTATSNASWITVTSGSSGSGNGTVGYSVAANTGAARTGTITIAGQTFTVNQTAGSSGCPVTPITVGQTINGILAITDCTLQDRGYVDIYSFSGTVGQQIAISMNSTAFDTYLLLVNSSNQILVQDDDGGGGLNSRIPATSGFFQLPATGTYLIYATSFSAGSIGAYTISLSGNCAYSINPSSASILASGGSGSTAVTTSTGCAWTATSNASWITVTSGSSGSGNGTVGYSVAANTTTSPRSGTITIAGQTFTVTQAGVSCNYAISQPSTNVGATSGTGSFTMTTSPGCTWTATSNATAWLTTSSTGNGNGTVSYSYLANSGAARSGAITVGGQTFTVNQAAGNISCPSPTTISVGQTVNGTLQTGDCTLNDGSFYDSYSFSGTVGQQIFITMNSTQFNTYLLLAQGNFPGGTIIAQDNNGNGGTNARIPATSGFLTLPATGTYTILANSFAAGETGSYSLTLGRNSPTLRRLFDFDGDGKSDMSVYRPSTGVWYLLNSQTGFTATQFGIASDRIASADFDGDGKTDIAVYRDGIWYLLRSASGFTALQFGIAEDIPQPADFDGDGRAEIAVYRPSTGVWYSLNLANNQFTALQFGISEDKPVVGDYDGDGKTDLAVYRPSTGVWYILQSTQGFTASQFGIQEDKPVPADYDGDGKTDLAVYRPSSGVWYFLRSTQGFTAIQFGIQTDKPTPADFDGDGKSDIAVYRPSNGVWYLLNSLDNSFTGIQFGIEEDKPIPNAFVP